MIGFAVSGSAAAPRFSGLAELPNKNSRRPQPGSSSEIEDTRVEISAEAEHLRAQSDLLRAVFRGVEQKVAPQARLAFERAGRSEYLESSLNDSARGMLDLSPEATAARILGGIQGFIYRAFMAEHPGATAEDFEQFKAEVVRGFEQGMSEAKNILRGLGMHTNDLAGEIEQTETLVREGLAKFFAEERERFERT